MVSHQSFFRFPRSTVAADSSKCSAYAARVGIIWQRVATSGTKTLCGRGEQIDSPKGLPGLEIERKSKARGYCPQAFAGSGRSDLNRRHSRWQRDALPLSYARNSVIIITLHSPFVASIFCRPGRKTVRGRAVPVPASADYAGRDAFDIKMNRCGGGRSLL